MSNETVSPDGVFVIGNFFNGSAEALEDNGDGTWSYRASYTKGDSLFYLFYNGQGSEELKDGLCLNEADQHRWLVVPEADELSIDKVCFNYCTACDAIMTTTTDIWLERLQFRLFPNPMQNGTMVSWENNFSIIKRIELIAPNGQLIRTYEQLTDTQLFIKKENLSSGLYFLKLTDDRGRTMTDKLFVQ